MTLYELTGDFIKLLDTKKEIDDAEVQNSVRKTFRINGLTSLQLSLWTFVIVAVMAIINIVFLCVRYI